MQGRWPPPCRPRWPHRTPARRSRRDNGACDAHSPIVTTLALGNATGAASLPVPGYPNAAAFDSVSGTSHSRPSTLIFRHGPRNASACPRSPPASRPARTPPAPARARAAAAPAPARPSSPCPATGPSTPSPPGSPTAGPMPPRNPPRRKRQRHREIHHDVRRELPAFPPRALPVAPATSSTASRGTQDASTPREIQSLKRPSATLSVCVISSDHAGNQPKHPPATRQDNQDQLELSGIGQPPRDGVW
jgi:hypothetical protein